MAQAKGSNSKLIFDQETNFGTTPASPAAQVAYFENEGFAQTIEQIESSIIRGNRNPTAPLMGNRRVSGSVATELAPIGQAIWFKHLMGSVTTTGAGPYSHVFKVGVLPVGLCFEKQFLDLTKYVLYNGVRVASASFDFSPAGKVAASYSFVGQKETVSGASFDATPVDLGHSPFQGFQAAIEEGGATIGVVTAAKLEINNDIQSDQYVIGGGGYVYGLPEGIVKVSGSLTALFDSMALYDKAVAGTESSLKLTLSKGDGLGSAGNESLEFFVPELRFQATTPTIKDSKGLLIELPFTAYLDNAASATALQITLKNSQATI